MTKKVAVMARARKKIIIRVKAMYSFRCLIRSAMVSSVNENVDYKLQLGCVDVDMVLNLFKIGDIIGKC